MDAQLRTWLTETAYYAVATGRNNGGDPTYGSATAFLCRTEQDMWEHGPAFGPRKGEDAETNDVIFTITAITLDMVIWLPGVSTSDLKDSYRPRRVEKVRDEFGRISHYEVYI